MLEDVEIEWVVLRNKGKDDAVNFNFPPNVTVRDGEDWDTLIYDEDDNKKEFDMYLIYPQVPALGAGENKQKVAKDVIYYLKSIPQDKIVLSCTEYNANQDNRMRHQSLQQYYPIVQRLDTGFNQLGVYIETPIQNKLQTPSPQLASLIFSNQSETNYFEKSHLYFGYYNRMFSYDESANNKIDQINYVVTCIKDALYWNKVTGLHKDIDIAIDLDKNALAEIYKQLTKEEQNAIQGIIHRTKADALVQSTTNENNKINIRIINPFPLKHEEMLYLITKSNPLTMLTGDQSFTEGLTSNKIIFYQIMRWKDNLYDQFLTEIKLFHIKNNIEPNLLYQFYDLQKQAKTSNEFWQLALDFYHTNRDELQRQQSLFANYLQEERNLFKSFTPSIMKVLDMDPFLKACALGQIEKVKEYLYAENVNVNGPLDTYGNNPLLLAIKNGHYEVVKALVVAKANLHVENHAAQSPLKLANEYYLNFLNQQNIINKDGLKLANLIIKEANEQYLTAVLGTAGQNTKSFNEFLLKENLSATDINQIFTAIVKSNKPDLIPIICKSAKVDMNQHDENGISVFIHAILMNNVDCVKAMLDPNLNLSLENIKNGLDIAVKLGYKDIVQMICETQPKLINTNNSQDNPILLALKSNNPEIFSLLLSVHDNKSKALGSLYGEPLQPLLHYAVKHNALGILKILVNEHIDINAKGFDNKNALETWIESCFNNRQFENITKSFTIQIPSLLISHGATLNDELIKKINNFAKNEFQPDSWRELQKLISDNSLKNTSAIVATQPQQLNNSHSTTATVLKDMNSGSTPAIQGSRQRSKASYAPPPLVQSDVASVNRQRSNASHAPPQPKIESVNPTNNDQHEVGPSAPRRPSR